MRGTESRRRVFYRYSMISLLVLFLLSAAFFALELWDGMQAGFQGNSPEDDRLLYQGQWYGEKKSLETFLVLGLDKVAGHTGDDAYNNDKRADFLLLFVFDHEAEKCTTIHIDRDTMVEMNVLGVAGNKVSTVTKQIALAHTYGNGRDVSCRNTADAVSKLLLGVQIDHYMSVTMDAVATVTDLAGGVEVTVLEDFSGIDDTLVKGETVTLTGQQALTYVRTRYGLDDSSNSTRMQRQRQFLQALQQKIGERMEMDDAFLMQAATQLSQYLVSDRSVNQLQQLAEKNYRYESGGTLELQGEIRQGEEFMEFHPDQDTLRKMVVDVFFESKD